MSEEDQIISNAKAAAQRAHAAAKGGEDAPPAEASTGEDGDLAGKASETPAGLNLPPGAETMAAGAMKMLQQMPPEQAMAFLKQFAPPEVRGMLEQMDPADVMAALQNPALTKMMSGMGLPGFEGAQDVAPPAPAPASSPSPEPRSEAENLAEVVAILRDFLGRIERIEERLDLLERGRSGDTGGGGAGSGSKTTPWATG